MQHEIQNRLTIFPLPAIIYNMIMGTSIYLFKFNNLSLHQMLLNAFHNSNSLSFPKLVALPSPFPSKVSKIEQICLEGYIIIFNCNSSIHLFYISDRHFPLYFDIFSSTEILIMFPAWSNILRSLCKFRTHQEDKQFQVILTILHWTQTHLSN